MMAGTTGTTGTSWTTGTTGTDSGGGEGDVETPQQRVEEPHRLGSRQPVGGEVVRPDGRVGEGVEHQGPVSELRVDGGPGLDLVDHSQQGEDGQHAGVWSAGLTANN